MKSSFRLSPKAPDQLGKCCCSLCDIDCSAPVAVELTPDQLCSHWTALVWKETGGNEHLFKQTISGTLNKYQIVLAANISGATVQVSFRHRKAV